MAVQKLLHVCRRWRCVLRRSNVKMCTQVDSQRKVEFLHMGTDKDDNERKIAYVKHEGDRSPGVIVIPGYFADMTIPKHVAVEQFCKSRAIPFVMYDSEGTGQSPGVHRNITYRTWVDNAIAVFDRLTEGPQIIVASSLGGWTATYMTLRRPHRVHSILHIGFGPLAQFDNTYEDAIKHGMEKAPKKVVDGWYRGEVQEMISKWGVKVKYWKGFAEDVPDDIQPGTPIPIKCPVRLLHARHDQDIIPKVALDYASRIESKDVDIYIRKTGNHRLMKAPDRKLTLEVLQALIRDYPVS